MNTKYIIIVSLGFIAILNSCKKSDNENINENKEIYTNLNDTLFKVESYGWGDYVSRYFLDIDDDHDTDIVISSRSYYYHFSSGSSIEINTENGFEISYLKYGKVNGGWDESLPGAICINDTITLPKEYYSYDTIKYEDFYTNDSLLIINYSGGGSQGVGIRAFYGITQNKDLYIAFRQKDGNLYNLAWLKIRVIDSNSIILSRSYFVKNVDYLVIK